MCWRGSENGVLKERTTVVACKVHLLPGYPCGLWINIIIVSGWRLAFLCPPMVWLLRVSSKVIWMSYGNILFYAYFPTSAASLYFVEGTTSSGLDNLFEIPRVFGAGKSETAQRLEKTHSRLPSDIRPADSTSTKSIFCSTLPRSKSPLQTPSQPPSPLIGGSSSNSTTLSAPIPTSSLNWFRGTWHRRTLFPRASATGSARIRRPR